MAPTDNAPAGTQERELVIERIFNAPRELVWNVWTQPEHFMRWYGPSGFSVPTCEIDLRVGGRHRFGLRSPDGQGYSTTGVFREVVPFERLVLTDAPADEHGNPLPDTFETTVTVTLEDLGDGQTRLTLRQSGWPDDTMATHAGGGWNQAFDKLAALLPDL
jgi:uncharacterized protein YndB with AHSA1/START domain